MSDGNKNHIQRRDVLKAVGVASAAGMVGLAGCTTEPSDGNGGGGGGNGSTGGGSGSNRPDTLVIIGYPQSGVQLFKDYYSDYGTGTPILVTDGLNDPDLPSDVGRPLKNVRGTAPAAAGPGREFFTDRYQEEYGRAPGVFNTQAYDATAVLLLANLAAGANDGTAIRDSLRSIANPKGPKMGPKKLVEAVEIAAAGDDLNYTGASSSVNFDENGDMRAVAYDLFSFTNNGIKTQRTIQFEGEGGGSAGAPPGTGSDAGRTIRLGALMAETGDLANVGKPIRDAAVLPQKQLAGAIDFTIDMRVADAQTNPQAGISAANTLINSGYSAIVGPLSSGVNIPVCKQVYIPNQIVGCSPSSTTPQVTALKDNDYVYRTAPSDALQGQVLAQVASEEVNAKTAATLFVNNAYGQALSNTFTKAFEKAGGTVSSQVGFEKAQSSYTSKIQAAMTPS